MNQASHSIQTLPTIGRFFSLQQGRVGQYLSPRVLIVRHPFRSHPADLHCFGFPQEKSAIRFAQHLAYRGYTFELKRNTNLTQHSLTRQPYEIHLTHHNAKKLAQTIAFWDRQS